MANNSIYLSTGNWWWYPGLFSCDRLRGVWRHTYCSLFIMLLCSLLLLWLEALKSICFFWQDTTSSLSPIRDTVLHCSCEGKQAENKEAKMTNLASAHNTSLLFHQISSLENCQSIERRQRDMQGVRRKKGNCHKADCIGFPQEASLPVSALADMCTKRKSKFDVTFHPYPRIWMSVSQNEVTGFPLKSSSLNHRKKGEVTLETLILKISSPEPLLGEA